LRLEFHEGVLCGHHDKEPARVGGRFPTHRDEIFLRQDPDGIEVEVMWMAPREQWGEYEQRAVVRPLDLSERWSASDTPLTPEEKL